MTSEIFSRRKPNVVYLLAEQWRAQATGYSGEDPNVETPHLDTLAKESINFKNAVSCCPVCSPYRASLITGRFPLTHGVFLNDLCLNTEAVSIAQAYKRAGYTTAYIGKWHLDGHGRNGFIPRERRQGFEFWKVMECTHDYNNSFYYGDKNEKLKWDRYDAIAQTREAQRYIRTHVAGEPFALFVSWGPPHAPYLTAPPEYKAKFKESDIVLRDNVPAENEKEARRDLAGYYAHIAAMDDCVRDVMKTLDECGLTKDTILVFTADHGDMMYSKGQLKKQSPYDESIRVPFLLRYPVAHGSKGRVEDMVLNVPDIMPTLLGLSGVDTPYTVEGSDYSGVVRGTKRADKDGALIMCPSPFSQWSRDRGGREYRGIRTTRYTYTRDLKGPWLLYDNEKDPCQQNNLCNKPEYAKVQKKLEEILTRKLKETNDEFLPGQDYIKKWGYKVNENGSVPYKY